MSINLRSLNILAILVMAPLFTINEMRADTVDSLTYYLLDDYVLQGTKEQTKLYVMPLSSTTIDAEKLDLRNVTSMKDFTGMVPNFIMIDRDTPHTSSVLVRGIGSKLRPAVVMYVDGVPHFEKSTFEFALNDVEKIDFLRGPQGTTYGRNAMGGIILVQTRSPFRHRGTSVRINGNTLGEMNARASHLGRISDHWAYSLAGTYRYFKGYIPNEFDGSMSDKAREGALNAKLEYSPSANTLVRFVNNFDITRQGAFTYGTFDPETKLVGSANLNHKSQYDRKMYDGGLIFTHHTDKHVIHGQLSTHLVDALYDVDQDGTAANIAFVLQSEKQKLFSQELRMESKYEGWYNWTIGLFGFQQQINRRVDITQKRKGQTSLTHRTNNEYSWGAAAYHQSSLTFGKFRFDAGVRFEYEKARLKYFEDKAGVKDDYHDALPFVHITPKASVQYFVTPTMQVYATVAQGYITGGFNTVRVGEDERFYGAEKSWNYEVGAKGAIIPGRLSAELALFAISTKDKQLNKIIPGLGQSTYNAGNTLSRGIEASLDTHITSDWHLSATYGYTHAVFTKYIAAKNEDYLGNFLPFVPRHTVAANTEYTIPLKSPVSESLILHLGYKGIGDMYWHENNAVKQAFYHLLDASVGVRSGGIHCTIWGTNLVDSKYLGYYYTVEKRQMGKPGRPRAIGMSIAYQF